MDVHRIIAAKRDRRELSPEDITAWILEYARGNVPDYQAAALLMAVYLNGMSPAETAALTRAMVESGTALTWNDRSTCVDKHSTGGVGDKTSLILAPLLACLGFQVPMISGRGLGATGGTLDKLESIPGFVCSLNREQLCRQVVAIGCAIASASDDLAPADRRLYALRDVTATVASVPLITASILSKKVAEGISALILDVKAGSGAFMKTVEEARRLATSLVEVGQLMGLRVRALITDMHQPLGNSSGHTLEVDESLEVLNGGGPDDLRRLCVRLAAEMLTLTGHSSTLHDALDRAGQPLTDGSAKHRFEQMIEAQHGDLDAARPRARQHILTATRSGFFAGCAADVVGESIRSLGGGRFQLGDRIDHAVGVRCPLRIGQAITSGQPVLEVHADALPDSIRDQLARALDIVHEPPPDRSLVLETVSTDE